MKKGLSIISFVLFGLFFLILSTPVHAASGDETQKPEIIYESAADVTPIYKEAILSRAESLAISVKFYPVEGEDIYQQAMLQAAEIENGITVHNGNPVEGDYLRQYCSNPKRVDYYQDGDHYVNRITWTMSYPITAEQEEELTEAIDSLIASVIHEGMSDYEKAFILFRWVAAHVTYKITQNCYYAYGAMIEGEAICNGIAQLMYRLFLSAGLDARFVGGFSGGAFGEGALHAWNIVKIDDYYYNVDATWATGINDFNTFDLPWFLLCKYTFEHEANYLEGRHYRGDYYRSEEFNTVYPIAPLDYWDESTLIETGQMCDINLEAGGFQRVVFEPQESGRYTFSSVNAPLEVNVEVEQKGQWFQHNMVLAQPLAIVDTSNGNNFSFIYKLEEGNRYVFRVSFKDTEQSGTVSVSMTRNPSAEVSITDISCDDYFYYEGTGSYETINGETIMYYRAEPKNLQVVLNNGQILQGTPEDILEQLNASYDTVFYYSFQGDNQGSGAEWTVGIHEMTVSFNDFSKTYDVVIANNPIQSVQIEELPYIYGNEYTKFINGNYRDYIFLPGSIVVTTNETSFSGTYDELYQQFCEAYEYDFPRSSGISVRATEDEILGYHEYPITLFGVNTTLSINVLYNPISSIFVENKERIVSEQDKVLMTVDVPGDNGEVQTVSYMAYPHEPLTVTATMKDGMEYTGTPEQTMAYLRENYGFYEVFQYSDMDTPDDPWGYGAHELTISIRGNKNPNNDWYTVIVKADDPIELELNTPITAAIEEPGQTLLFSYTAGNSSNRIYSLLSENHNRGIFRLYNENMELLDMVEGTDASERLILSFFQNRNVTRYFSVGFSGNQTGDISIVLTNPLNLYSFTNIDTDIYENQGVVREEIINGEPVQYTWYDWNPRHLTIGRFSGTLDEITQALWDEGVNLHYAIDYSGYQSYDQQWKAGADAYSVVLKYLATYRTISGISIHEGPILSMSVDDITYGSGFCSEATEIVDGVEHTYLRYDTTPIHLTAQTVDGEISGTIEDIQNYLKDTYDLTLECKVEGDDQSWQNLWDIGEHELTLSIGNVSASYKVIISDEAKTAIIRQATASFEGKFIMNFYLQLSDAVLADEGAYVLLTGGETNRKVLVSEATANVSNGETLYRFSYPVVAKEIRDNINLKLYDGEGRIIKITNLDGTNDYTETGVNYSLMTYCTRMISSNSSSAEMKALAQATIDYGTAAQIYFNHHAEGLSVSDNVTAVSLEELGQYKGEFEGSLEDLEGVTGRQLSALFEDDNSLRIYFTYADGYNPSMYSYTVDGIPAEIKVKETADKELYYLEVAGVPSNKLDVVHRLSISDGSTTYTIKVSVLTYARSSVMNGTEARKNLGKALYLYNISAKNKFGE